MDLGARRAVWLGWGEGLLASPAASVVCLCVLAGKESSVLNWQDCEAPQPQARSPASAQCEATQLYPLPQPPSPWWAEKEEDAPSPPVITPVVGWAHSESFQLKSSESRTPRQIYM